MEHRCSTDMFIINEILEKWTIEKLLPGHYCHNAEDGRNFIRGSEGEEKICCICHFAITLRSEDKLPNEKLLTFHVEKYYQCYYDKLKPFYPIFNNFMATVKNIFCLYSVFKNRVQGWRNIEDFEELSETDCNDFEKIELKVLGTRQHKIEHYQEFYWCKKLLSFLFKELSGFNIDVSRRLIQDIINAEKDVFVIDHCHITGTINGFAHRNCNSKKQFKNIPLNIYTHNGSKLDYKILCHEIRIADFGFMKLNPIGKSSSNISNFSIDNRIIFKDTMQYFNCSHDALTETRTKEESLEIRMWVIYFMEKGNKYLWLTFLSLEEFEKEKILTFFESKLSFPYELIINRTELKENRKELPDIENFFSSLKNNNKNEELYESLSFVYTKLRMRNLRDLLLFIT